MKIAIFTNDCPIQIALVNKINEHVDVDTVFLAKNRIEKTKKRKNKYIYYFLRLVRIPFELPLRMAWDDLKKRYKEQYIEIPKKVTQYYVNNINDESVIKYVKNTKPKLIIVSATTMLKADIISEASKVNCLILNLHTGISPYIKGGPNCTNWCLATNNYLIGNTVMVLDSGIDSGAIIATELTTLTGTESLSELHYRVMEHGFELYIKVINSFVKKNMSFNPIKQAEISTKGDLYLTQDWTIWQVVKAYYNFKVNYPKQFSSYTLRNDIKVFPFVCKEIG